MVYNTIIFYKDLKDVLFLPKILNAILRLKLGLCYIRKCKANKVPDNKETSVLCG